MLSRRGKTQLVLCFGTTEIVMCLWITCTVLTLVASQQKFYVQARFGKRQDTLSDFFFVTGGRYGRSENTRKMSKSLPKLVEAEMPRIYRFFWGSRYGKLSPPDYRTVSSVNRFSAILNFIDQVALDRKNDESNRNDLDLLP